MLRWMGLRGTTGNMRPPPTTTRHRVVKRPSHDPGLEEPSGGVLAVGCWHTRQLKRNFNNLFNKEHSYENIS